MKEQIIVHEPTKLKLAMTLADLKGQGWIRTGLVTKVSSATFGSLSGQPQYAQVLIKK